MTSPLQCYRQANSIQLEYSPKGQIITRDVHLLFSKGLACQMLTTGGSLPVHLSKNTSKPVNVFAQGPQKMTAPSNAIDMQAGGKRLTRHLPC